MNIPKAILYINSDHLAFNNHAAQKILAMYRDITASSQIIMVSKNYCLNHYHLLPYNEHIQTTQIELRSDCLTPSATSREGSHPNCDLEKPPNLLPQVQEAQPNPPLPASLYQHQGARRRTSHHQRTKAPHYHQDRTMPQTPPTTLCHPPTT